MASGHCEVLFERALPAQEVEVSTAVTGFEEMWRPVVARFEEMAKTTPVFAPGLDHLFGTGAVAAIWDAGKPLDAQLATTSTDAKPEDERGALSRERGGQVVSADVADRVIAAARGAA